MSTAPTTLMQPSLWDSTFVPAFAAVQPVERETIQQAFERFHAANIYIYIYRMASHVEIADHLGIAPWRASGVCAYLHRRGLISLEQRGKRGPVSHPTIWHTKTNI